MNNKNENYFEKITCVQFSTLTHFNPFFTPIRCAIGPPTNEKKDYELESGMSIT